MKLRVILLVLGLLAFFSITAGGFFYYYSLRVSAIKDAEFQAEYHAGKIEDLISSYLADNQKAAGAMAGLGELSNALKNPGIKTLAQADSILDHFKKSLQVKVSYLMDTEGKTIASSNRNDSDSFIGKNYSFRPYFKKAVHGNPAVYLALGITSRKRGVYYSHPVYAQGQENPVGVVVLKSGVDKIEKEFISMQNYSREMITFITGPHGIIFMSDHKEFVYRMLWKTSRGELAQVQNLNQFGKGPWLWAGFARKNGNRAEDKTGSEYLIFQKPIKLMPGWNVVHMHNIQELTKNIAAPFMGTAGYIILLLCFFVGLSVFVLYKLGASDLMIRLRAEKALQESEKKYRSLVANIPDVVWTADFEGRVTYISSNIEKECGCTPDEIYKGGSGGWFDNIHIKDVENVKRAFKDLFEQGKLFDVEYRRSKKNGDWIWVHDRSLGTYEKDGAIHADGLLSNITERKYAQEERDRLIDELKEALTEVKTLSGLLPICSSCKKIRDDTGYWKQIEGYIQDHSDAVFSHGMCPECSEKLYGDQDWYIEMKNQNR